MKKAAGGPGGFALAGCYLAEDGIRFVARFALLQLNVQLHLLS
jgi:hypothetical protein